MKQFILLTLLLFYSITMFSQGSINGRILDEKTGEPVKFVNVGLLDIGIGTVSDDTGNFSIDITNNISTYDTLVVSAIGYRTKKFIAINLLSKENEIILEPLYYDIEEVVITPKKIRVIGSDSKSKHIIGYFNTRNALGGELATFVNVKNTPCRFKELSFHIVRNDYDSLTLRLNIYSIENRLPFENLLKENILIHIYQSEGVLSIDLEKHEIIISNDVIVSLELIELFGENDGYFGISANIGGNIYYRMASQDKWTKKNNMKLGISILTEYE